MKLLIGLGCSFMAGSEAGGKNYSFLSYMGKAMKADTLNFGIESQGNLGSVMHLLVNPIDTTYYTEIEIFFMPTGLNRVDVLSPYYSDKVPFFPVFPCTESPGVLPEVYELEVAYGGYWTPEMQALNFAFACRLLNLYVEKYNAKLTLFPAFNREYDKDLFDSILPKTVLSYSIPWENFIKIDGCSNFWDWSTKQSGTPIKYDMMEFLSTQQVRDEKLKLWVEEHLHPSFHAHKELANKIIQIKGYGEKDT